MASGSIYAIGLEGTSLVKIGCTTLPIAIRLGQLQTGHPFQLLPLATIAVEDNMLQIEKQIHLFLAADRRRGEWFDVAMDEGTLAALIARAVAYIAEQQALSSCLPTAGKGEHWSIGTRIARLRAEKQWSARHLETLADIPHGILSRLEHDQRTYPSVPVAMRLAKHLGVTLDYLCGMYDTCCGKTPTP